MDSVIQPGTEDLWTYFIKQNSGVTIFSFSYIWKYNVHLQIGNVCILKYFANTNKVLTFQILNDIGAYLYNLQNILKLLD